MDRGGELGKERSDDAISGRVSEHPGRCQWKKGGMILRIDRYKTAAKSLMAEKGRAMIDVDEER